MGFIKAKLERCVLFVTLIRGISVHAEPVLLCFISVIRMYIIVLTTVFFFKYLKFNVSYP